MLSNCDNPLHDLLAVTAAIYKVQVSPNLCAVTLSPVKLQSLAYPLEIAVSALLAGLGVLTCSLGVSLTLLVHVY